MNHHSNHTDGYPRLRALFSGVLLALLFAAGYVSCWVMRPAPPRAAVSVSSYAFGEGVLCSIGDGSLGVQPFYIYETRIIRP